MENWNNTADGGQSGRGSGLTWPLKNTILEQTTKWPERRTTDLVKIVAFHLEDPK